jgi:hypothetical protein
VDVYIDQESIYSRDEIARKGTSFFMTYVRPAALGYQPSICIMGFTFFWVKDQKLGKHATSYDQSSHGTIKKRSKAK